MDPGRAAELLARERRRIERALAELGANPADELSNLDLADGGSELFEQERDAGIAARLRSELAAIGRAEARLSAGTYGLSVESGKPIPDERLEALPAAERTIEEQAAYERG